MLEPMECCHSKAVENLYVMVSLQAVSLAQKQNVHPLCIWRTVCSLFQGSSDGNDSLVGG